MLARHGCGCQTDAMPPSFVMIDDFVANPHELRRQALGLGYDATAKDAGANYPGTDWYERAYELIQKHGEPVPVPAVETSWILSRSVSMFCQKPRWR